MSAEGSALFIFEGGTNVPASICCASEARRRMRDDFTAATAFGRGPVVSVLGEGLARAPASGGSTCALSLGCACSRFGRLSAREPVFCLCLWTRAELIVDAEMNRREALFAGSLGGTLFDPGDKVRASSGETWSLRELFFGCSLL